jgi:Zn-dependent protease with chaperone function
MMAYLPVLLLTFFITFIITTVGALFFSLPGIVDFTSRALSWCESILMLCLPYAPLIKAIGFWSVTIVIASGLLYSLALGFWGWRKEYRSLKRLPIADRGLSVALIKDDNIKIAFTHGLIRPKIYVSTGLLKSLTREEVKAVLLHEAHHRKKRDPLRFFCLTVLKDLLFYLPIVEWFARHMRQLKEIEADGAAIERTSEPLTLAGALVKVAKYGNAGLEPQPASIRGDGSVEERVRRIVYDKKQADCLPKRVLAKSVIVALVLLFSITLPISASNPLPHDCNMDHCPSMLKR